MVILYGSCDVTKPQNKSWKFAGHGFACNFLIAVARRCELDTHKKIHLFLTN